MDNTHLSCHTKGTRGLGNSSSTSHHSSAEPALGTPIPWDILTCPVWAEWDFSGLKSPREEPQVLWVGVDVHHISLIPAMDGSFLCLRPQLTLLMASEAPLSFPGTEPLCPLITRWPSEFTTLETVY